MKPVQLSKYEIDFRGIGRLKAFSGISGPSRFQYSNWFDSFLNHYYTKNREFFACNIDGRNKTCSYGEGEAWVWKKNNLPLLVAFWPSRKVKIPKQLAKASFLEPSSPRKADSFGLTLWSKKIRGFGEMWVWKETYHGEYQLGFSGLRWFRRKEQNQYW